MIIAFHRSFKKQFDQLTRKEKEKFEERLELFIHDPFHPLLYNHPLKGEYLDYRSINIAGDLRAIYKDQQDNIIFTDIGTHSDLYR
ncbi:MAG: type II toxin-antitoxin system mRNA interferase toxin, RelE/StbE family [bacterium]